MLRRAHARRVFEADDLWNRTPVGGRTELLPVELENGNVVGLQKCAALLATTSNTDWSSVGEVLMILKISAVVWQIPQPLIGAPITPRRVGDIPAPGGDPVGTAGERIWAAKFP